MTRRARSAAPAGLLERPVLAALIALGSAAERVVAGRLARPAPAGDIIAPAIAPLALALALHLLLEPLRAFPQRLERAALRVDRRALAGLPALALTATPVLAGLALIAGEVAFGLLHVALRVVEALLALHPQALELALQFGQPVAQSALALIERQSIPVRLVLVGLADSRRFVTLVGGVRTILVRLRLLVVLPRGRPVMRPLPRVVALIAAEGVVAQRLLIVQELLEFADLLAHLAFGGLSCPSRALRMFSNISCIWSSIASASSREPLRAVSSIWLSSLSRSCA